MLISREGHLVTLINVFETRPKPQQELIDHWMRFVDSVKGAPGMIGTSLHRSSDGTRVVNYAQWRSKADLDRFQKQYRQQMEACRQAASHVDPHLYEVVSVYEQEDELIG